MRWSRMAVHSHRNRVSRDDHENEEYVGYFNGFYMKKLTFSTWRTIDVAQRAKYISNYRVLQL